MTLYIAFAVLAGLLVGVSRQINGRLSLSTSPLRASFWNHLVGFVALTTVGLLVGGLWTDRLADIPPLAWLGGPIGVLFVAAGSWLIPRIGATATALLIIAGQMVSGVLLDAILGNAQALGSTTIGVVLILMGMALISRPKSEKDLST